MKHENDVSSMVVSELWEYTVCALYNFIFFLFVKTKNNFIKEIKHVFRAFIAWKPRQAFLRIWEQISENPRHSWGFLPAWEFPQALQRFSAGYGGMENMFYFFYKIIIFSL